MLDEFLVEVREIHYHHSSKENEAHYYLFILDNEPATEKERDALYRMFETENDFRDHARLLVNASKPGPFLPSNMHICPEWWAAYPLTAWRTAPEAIASCR